MRAKKTGRALLNGVILILMVMLAGTVAFAEEPEDPEGTECAPFTSYAPMIFQKVWDDGLDPSKRPDEITIKVNSVCNHTGLCEMNGIIDLTLTAENGWKSEPDPDHKMMFDSEDLIDGYYLTDFRLSAVPASGGSANLCTLTNTRGYTIYYEWTGLEAFEDNPRLANEWAVFAEENNITPPNNVSHKYGEIVQKVDRQYGPDEDNIVYIRGQFYEFSGWKLDEDEAAAYDIDDSGEFEMPIHDLHYTGEWVPLENSVVVLEWTQDLTGPMPFTAEMIKSGEIPLTEEYLKNYRYKTLGVEPDGTGSGVTYRIPDSGNGFQCGAYASPDYADEIPLLNDGEMYDLSNGTVYLMAMWSSSSYYSITYACERDYSIAPVPTNSGYALNVISPQLLTYSEDNIPGRHYKAGDRVYLPDAKDNFEWKGLGKAWNLKYVSLDLYQEFNKWEPSVKSVTIEQDEDGRYYFDMPAKDLTLTAKYQKTTYSPPANSHTVTYKLGTGEGGNDDILLNGQKFLVFDDYEYDLPAGTTETLLARSDPPEVGGGGSSTQVYMPGFPLRVGPESNATYYVFKGWTFSPEVELISEEGQVPGQEDPILPSFVMPDEDVTITGIWEESTLHDITYKAVDVNDDSIPLGDDFFLAAANQAIRVMNHAQIGPYSSLELLFELGRGNQLWGSDAHALNKGVTDEHYFFRLFESYLPDEPWEKRPPLTVTHKGMTYAYRGWEATDSAGTVLTKYNDVYWGGQYGWKISDTIGSIPLDYIIIPDDDITITTFWEAATYRVSYADGVEGELFETDNHHKLDLGAPTPAFRGTGEEPTRPGYTFEGWSPEVSDTVTGCVTYMPIWEREELGYVVIYEDGVPGEIVFRSQEFDKNVEDPEHAEDLLYAGDTTPRFPVLDKETDVGESKVDPETGENIPLRDGYRFLGWRLKTGKYPDPEGVPGGVHPIVKEVDCRPVHTIVYEAIWEKTDGPDEPDPGDDEGYTVIYKDGANGEAFAEQTYNRKDDGETLIYAGDDTPPFQPKEGDDGPVRPGYRFIGWSILSGEEKDPDTIIEVREKVQAKDSDEDPPRTIIYEARWERLLPEGTKCGVLVISKTVTGGGNPEQEFTFNVTLTLPEDYSGEPENEVSYIGLGGKADGIIELDENNRGTVTLKHGESVVIQRPSGTEYTVEEVLTSGYETTVEESHNTSGVFKTCEVAMVRVINRWMSSGTPAQYRVIHEYYTNGKYDGATRPEDFDGFVGQRINPDSIPRNWRYMGNVYNFRDITPSGLQVLTAGETLVFTLRYDRVEYTPSYPDPTPWPDPTPTPKPDPTPTPTPTPTPDPDPTPLPLPERPVDPGTGLVPYDPTVILEDLVPLAAPHLNITDHYAYIIGYPDGLVRSEGNVTRAEVATIFLRLMLDEYREENWSTENNFSDVAPTAWYNNAVSTCAKAGIIKGYPDGTFRPNENITRAEFAAIAARFVSDDVPGYDYFTDMEGHWARVDVARAVMAGWIRGEGRLFRPQDKITRAETATLVNRMINRFPDKDHLLPQMIRWPDNLESAWYYAEMQEATNSHDYEGGLLTMSEVWTYLLANRDWAALENEWSQAGDAPGGEVAPELQNGGTSSGESDDIQDILGDILGA